MPKVFQCSACQGHHKRQEGIKCPFQNSVSTESTSSGTKSTQDSGDNINSEILYALNAVSSRSMVIEQRIDRTEEQLQS